MKSTQPHSGSLAYYDTNIWKNERNTIARVPALLSVSGVDSRYCGDVASHADFLLNGTIIIALNIKRAYEVVSNDAPENVKTSIYGSASYLYMQE